MEGKGIILLTVYEAFGDFKVNPSIAACMRLDGRVFNRYKVVVDEISMDCLDRNGIDIPAVFIRVPRLPEQSLEGKSPSMSLDLIARALEIVVELIAKELESQKFS